MKISPGVLAMLAAIPFATAASAQDVDAPPAMQIGNGEKNRIVVEGLKRADAASTYTELRATSDRQHVRRGNGVTLVIPEVQIDGDGWLVMHPFIGGKPSGDYVAGYSFVESGINNDVSITLNPAPESGERFIVMLHKDANEDRVFDFVFVSENVVEDEAVFEGGRMVAHVITVP